MIIGLMSLCAVSMITSWLAVYFQIPIPGAIIGLLVLFCLFTLRGKPGASIERASQTLTLYIPLLIMPSCIGIMDHWELIKAEWLPILIAISLSVLFTLITTPWLFARLAIQPADHEA